MSFDVVLAKPHQMAKVLDLIQRTFAYMEDRIDPPSSMHDLNLENVLERQANGDVLLIGDIPEACMFIEEKGEALYLGKLAVEPKLRGNGRFDALIEKAESIAGARGLSMLEIESRIELTEVHRAFARLGFKETRKGSHDGYQKPTYIVMRMSIG